jgi:hypothetical protein
VDSPKRSKLAPRVRSALVGTVGSVISKRLCVADSNPIFAALGSDAFAIDIAGSSDTSDNWGWLDVDGGDFGGVILPGSPFLEVASDSPERGKAAPLIRGALVGTVLSALSLRLLIAWSAPVLAAGDCNAVSIDIIGTRDTTVLTTFDIASRGGDGERREQRAEDGGETHLVIYSELIGLFWLFGVYDGGIVL